MEVASKVCRRCLQNKTLDMFNNDKSVEGGKAAICRECRAVQRKSNPEAIAAYNKKWYDKNRAYILKTAAEFRRDNRDYLRKEALEHYYKNREDILQRQAKYVREHPGEFAAKSAKRRAIKRNATPAWAEDESTLIRALYNTAQKKSVVSGIKFDVDHIVPLTSDIVCGLHCYANLQVIPSKENISKGNRWWPDMWTDADFPQTQLAA